VKNKRVTHNTSKRKTEIEHVYDTKRAKEKKRKNETRKEEEILEKQHTTLLEHDLLRTKWGLESFPR